MECTISVIIPNWNGESTIAPCLEAVFASRHDSFEVIVVDDCSSDNSRAIIKQYPCRFVRFSHHQGTAKARNAGAKIAQGKIIFFTDADCVIQPDTLARIDKSFNKKGKDVIVGGTYTCMPYDRGFFNVFQSVFVHYFEVKNRAKPDYIAAHAMVIATQTFKESGGFSEEFLLPLIEDVEYTHRLNRQGFQLETDQDLQVRHIFNFSLITSLKNAFRKSKYWTIYSLGNRDLFKDSGCASYELKINVFSFVGILLLFLLYIFKAEVFSPLLISIPITVNLVVNRHLLHLYYRTGGAKIAVMASLYYMLIYSAAVGFGGLAGVLAFFRHKNHFVVSRTLWHHADH